MSRTRGSAESSDRLAQRVALVGGMVAGHETQFRNVCSVAQGGSTFKPLVVPVWPFRAQDGIERFARFLPSSTRSTLRSMFATAPLFLAGHLDAVWTNIELPLLPWLLTAGMIRRVPVVYDADSTPRLLRGFGAHYGYWGGRSPVKQRMRDVLHGICLRRGAVVNAWTHWAGRSLRDDYGVSESRLCVIPPGVDVDHWRPTRTAGEDPKPGGSNRHVRLLFVGGDFIRKGGDLLLSVYRVQLREIVEMDVVTRSPIPNGVPGIRFHTSLGSNDPRLLNLYQRADIFVLPTRADCFSMAGVEALATGLPVVTCPVGGVAELLESGRQGFFVPPDDGRSLAEALLALIGNPARRRRMGDAARDLAVARYSAQTNTIRLLDLVRASCTSGARSAPLEANS